MAEIYDGPEARGAEARNRTRAIGPSAPRPRQPFPGSTVSDKQPSHRTRGTHMRRTQLLTLAATAALTALPAGAQDVRILTPRARVEGGFDDANRAAIGISTTATGTLRDTLGLIITMVTRGSPAERAGIEEGNRIQAINGVNLRANAADIEYAEMSGSLSRRLTRALSKAKPGDEVELRVYREGRTQAIRVKTVDADSLFRRGTSVRFTRADAEDRPALGLSIQSSGSRRD